MAVAGSADVQKMITRKFPQGSGEVSVTDSPGGNRKSSSGSPWHPWTTGLLTLRNSLDGLVHMLDSDEIGPVFSL